jgi:hypothetical protein
VIGFDFKWRRHFRGRRRNCHSLPKCSMANG